MTLKEELRIKSAEFWLKLGEPVPALLELQQLPKKAQRCAKAQRVLQTAFRTCIHGG